MTIPATIATGGHVTDPEIVDAQLAILQLLLAFTNGVLNVANGGSGSATQNFVDLTTGQNVAGQKVFTNANTYFGVGSGGASSVRIREGAAANTANLFFENNAGTSKWLVGKDAADGLILFDNAASRNILSCATSGFPVILQEAWAAPTLLNSYANVGGGNLASGYFKDSQGVVHLRGYVTSGAAAPIFTLPTGYRPSAQAQFSTEHNGAYGRIVVRNTGSVESDVGGFTNVSLDGITFDTR